jgi:hypothetical protein
VHTWRPQLLAALSDSSSASLQQRGYVANHCWAASLLQLNLLTYAATAAITD